jgi:hypothetical protein
MNTNYTNYTNDEYRPIVIGIICIIRMDSYIGIAYGSALPFKKRPGGPLLKIAYRKGYTSSRP